MRSRPPPPGEIADRLLALLLADVAANPRRPVHVAAVVGWSLVVHPDKGWVLTRRRVPADAPELVHRATHGPTRGTLAKVIGRWPT